ncbi:hypothetical protein T439DRAFT_382829 [Meredithblackwellia eburnea MCA 4105]
MDRDEERPFLNGKSLNNIYPLQAIHNLILASLFTFLVFDSLPPPSTPYSKRTGSKKKGWQQQLKPSQSGNYPTQTSEDLPEMREKQAKDKKRINKHSQLLERRKEREEAAAAHDAYPDSDQERDVANNINDELKQEVKTLKNDLKSESKKVTRLEEQLAKATEENLRLRKEVEKQTILTGTEEDFNTLNLAEARLALIASSAKCKLLEAELENAKYQLGLPGAKKRELPPPPPPPAHPRAEAEIAHLRATMEKMEGKIAGLETTRANLEGKIKSLEGRETKLVKEKELLAKEKKEVDSKLAHKSEPLKELEKELLEAYSNIDELNDTITLLRHCQKDPGLTAPPATTEKEKKLSQNISSLEKKVVSLQEELKTSQGLTGLNAKQVKELKAKMEKLEVEHSVSTKNLSEHLAVAQQTRIAPEQIGKISKMALQVVSGSRFGTASISSIYQAIDKLEKTLVETLRTAGDLAEANKVCDEFKRLKDRISLDEEFGVFKGLKNGSQGSDVVNQSLDRLMKEEVLSDRIKALEKELKEAKSVTVGSGSAEDSDPKKASGTISKLANQVMNLNKIIAELRSENRLDEGLHVAATHSTIRPLQGSISNRHHERIKGNAGPGIDVNIYSDMVPDSAFGVSPHDVPPSSMEGIQGRLQKECLERVRLTAKELKLYKDADVQEPRKIKKAEEKLEEMKRLAGANGVSKDEIDHAVAQGEADKRGYKATF